MFFCQFLFFFQFLRPTVCLNSGRTHTANISTTPLTAAGRAFAATAPSAASASPAPLQPVRTPSCRSAVGPARVQLCLFLPSQTTLNTLIALKLCMRPPQAAFTRAESGPTEKPGTLLPIRARPAFAARAPSGASGNPAHPPAASTRCRGSAACPAMVSYNRSSFPVKF